MYDESDEEGLGGGFWLWLVGLVVGGAVAAVIIFMVMGWAWYTWGFFGAFFLLALVSLGVGFVYDRRQERETG
jgi:O-antigen ligase